MLTTLQAIYEADSGILKLERKLDIANYSVAWLYFHCVSS